MFAVSSLIIWFGIRFPWIDALASGSPFGSLVPAATPTPTPTSGSSGDATTIRTFFTNLSSDLMIFALAMAGFFFALSALFYMSSGATGNERTRQHAISALYAALVGLALALLAASITALISNAAGH